MAIESIKNQMQFQEVQKTNLKTVDTPNNNVNTEVKPIVTSAQGSTGGTADNTTEDNQKAPLPETRIKSAVNHANSHMKHAKTRCEFSYHEKTNRISIKVIDKDTEEVIREIPPEETLEMVEKMWELAGILVDERR